MDLPWNYQQKGLSFTDAALHPSSWFDHEYPLQNIPCCEQSILTYDGLLKNLYYRSHSGYDYAASDGVELGTPVLAVAEGIASFLPAAKSNGAGNVIKIDHGNGYQTWYEHLSSDGLIVNTEDQTTHVNSREIIGKVGLTGNTTGAHIHLSLFNDSNKNGDFTDDYPYGLTDPFGWEGNSVDPWELWTNGIDLTKKGAKSYYLWDKSLGATSGNLSSIGATFNSNRFSFLFPANTVSELLNISLTPKPAFSSLSITSLGPTLFAIAKDTLGYEISNFLQPFNLTINFANIDLSLYDLSTLSIYSSQDGQNWNKEITNIDFLNQTATSQISHFSYFALMAEPSDTTAPTTTALLLGDEGENNWYKSNVALSLSSEDNQNGLGVQFSAYKINDDIDWQEYKIPVLLTDEGHYKIKFYSEDNAGNIEQEKSIEFDIDKSTPSASILVSPTILWPPNEKKVLVEASGSFFDQNLSSKIIKVNDEYGKINYSVNLLENPFKEKFYLPALRKENDKNGRVYTFTLEVKDKAGNISKVSKEVIVPHDLRQVLKSFISEVIERMESKHWSSE